MSEPKNNNHSCEGCYTISTCRHTRHTEKYHRKCPCKQCIVKVMCNDMCAPYSKWQASSQDIRPHIIKG